MRVDVKPLGTSASRRVVWSRGPRRPRRSLDLDLRCPGMAMLGVPVFGGRDFNDADCNGVNLSTGQPGRSYNFASPEKSVGHRYAPLGQKLGSRSPRTRCWIARLRVFLFVASCLSNQVARSGKRYALRQDLSPNDGPGASVGTVSRSGDRQDRSDISHCNLCSSVELGPHITTYMITRIVESHAIYSARSAVMGSA